MKLYSVLFLGGISASPAIFENSKEASQHLARVKRNNNGLFEEARGANLERECIEEICSFDEVMEVFEDQAKADAWWADATKKCSGPDACNRQGTKTCVNMWRSRRCDCREGWQNTDDADDCSTDIDECAQEGFCMNGGSCENSIGGFTCHCAQGWTGLNCEQDVDECAADSPACQNGGTCINSEGSFSCECTAQWQGDYCETDVDECANAAANGETLCDNAGGCINTQGDFECLCTGGWGGKTCGEDFDECAAALCPAGTVCKHVAQSFTCECPERGCNNLDEAVYQSRLMQTYGNLEASESSGAEVEEEETIEIEVTDGEDFIEVDEVDNVDVSDYNDSETTDAAVVDDYNNNDDGVSNYDYNDATSAAPVDDNAIDYETVDGDDIVSVTDNTMTDNGDDYYSE